MDSIYTNISIREMATPSNILVDSFGGALFSVKTINDKKVVWFGDDAHTYNVPEYLDEITAGIAVILLEMVRPILKNGSQEDKIAILHRFTHTFVTLTIHQYLAHSTDVNFVVTRADAFNAFCKKYDKSTTKPPEVELLSVKPATLLYNNTIWEYSTEHSTDRYKVFLNNIGIVVFEKGKWGISPDHCYLLYLDEDNDLNDIEEPELRDLALRTIHPIG